MNGVYVTYYYRYLLNVWNWPLALMIGVGVGFAALVGARPRTALLGHAAGSCGPGWESVPGLPVLGGVGGSLVLRGLRLL